MDRTPVAETKTKAYSSLFKHQINMLIAIAKESIVGRFCRKPEDFDPLERKSRWNEYPMNPISESTESLPTRTTIPGKGASTQQTMPAMR